MANETDMPMRELEPPRGRAASRRKTAARPRRRTRAPDQTREALLRAAVAEFAREGYGGARVDRISDTLDPTTRTAKVRFVVANPMLRLKPEMFVDVTLFVDELQQAMSVPAAAVLTEGDRTFVYVEIDAHTFARRSVDVASDARDTRRILRGVNAGDRIVTSGALLLRAQEARASN